MKKSLFAITILTLMGGQLFAADYKASVYIGKDLNATGADILTVDSESLMKSFQHKGASITLAYENSSCLNVKTDVLLNVASGGTTRNITATDSAAQDWINALTAADAAQITIISAGNMIIVQNTNPYAIQLMGATVGDTITLTGTTDTLTAVFGGYKGFSSSPLTDLEDGKIYIKLTDGLTNLTLVGKGLTKSPITPEPTTTTLSLLALAGMATRRRRGI